MNALLTTENPGRRGAGGRLFSELAKIKRLAPNSGAPPRFDSQILSSATIVLLLASCTTSMTNLADPHALRPGQVEVTLAGQGTASSVVLSKSWDGGAALYEQVTGAQGVQLATLTDPSLVDTGVAWALFSPRIDPEAAFEPKVAPIMLRAMAIAPTPRMAKTRTGALVMKRTSPA